MTKDATQIVINDFITLLRDTSKEEKTKDFKELADLITTYLEATRKKREKTELYKSAKDNYNKLYDKLLDEVSQEELDTFESSIFKMYEIDAIYLYLQGVVDGKSTN